MLSRVYRIPKGQICLSDCPFIHKGSWAARVPTTCAHYEGILDDGAIPMRLPQCQLDFPYGGIVTVDAEGPSRADTPDMSDENLDRGLGK